MHHFRFDPFRRSNPGILLEKSLFVNAVWGTEQRLWPVLKVLDDMAIDAIVVVYYIALRVTFCWPEYFIGMGKTYRPLSVFIGSISSFWRVISSILFF